MVEKKLNKSFSAKQKLEANRQSQGNYFNTLIVFQLWFIIGKKGKVQLAIPCCLNSKEGRTTSSVETEEREGS